MKSIVDNFMQLHLCICLVFVYLTVVAFGDIDNVTSSQTWVPPGGRMCKNWFIIGMYWISAPVSGPFLEIQLRPEF